jgi:hypothetical protein
LHLAAVYDWAEIVKILLSNGANIEAKDMWGKTPKQAAENVDTSDQATEKGDFAENFTESVWVLEVHEASHKKTASEDAAAP